VIEVTCALILDRENKILVTQRSSLMSLPLKWEFPGGKIEPNETAEQCLIREIKEELNIHVEIVGSMPPNIHSYPSITIKLVPFICRHIDGDILLKEHADFQWLQPNDLLSLDWAEADIPIAKSYMSSLR
jgi:8-oxo-dGTP diphosphatase